MQILTTPNSYLRKTAKTVNTITKTTLGEIEEMITMLKNTHDPKGVGLAATQVGINKRIFVLILKRSPVIFINPEIVSKSEDKFSDHYPDKADCWMEGCLSIPHIWGFVDRPYKITLKYQTLDQNNRMISQTKEFEDMEAAFVQHERDHLDGVLFTDYVLKQGGQLFREDKGKFLPISL